MRCLRKFVRCWSRHEGLLERSSLSHKKWKSFDSFPEHRFRWGDFLGAPNPGLSLHWHRFKWRLRIKRLSYIRVRSERCLQSFVLTSRGSRRRRLALRIRQRRNHQCRCYRSTDLATRQEACNPNYAIVKADGSSFLWDLASWLLFRGFFVSWHDGDFKGVGHGWEKGLRNRAARQHSKA